MMRYSMVLYKLSFEIMSVSFYCFTVELIYQHFSVWPGHAHGRLLLARRIEVIKDTEPLQELLN